MNMRPVSDNTRKNVLSLLHEGRSYREIAKRCNVGKSCVLNIKKRHFPDHQGSKGGRPQKLSPQDQRFCVRAITAGQLETATQVTKKLKDDIGVEVSVKTVRRALHKAGLGSTEKEKKPKLSPANIKARLEFANNHKNWTVDDWTRVIWSDETKINRFGSDGRSWCWKRDGERAQARHIKQTVKHGGGSIMIWGCMTSNGVGHMCKITGTMDQYLYRSILEDEFMQTIGWHDLDVNKVIFQQDNDPKHTALSVQQWLNQQAFQVLQWPPQSPDLNPIEHLWAILKRRLNQYEEPPKGLLELWERVQVEWDRIDEQTCRRLIESMPRRIEAVIKAKGMWTNY